MPCVSAYPSFQGGTDLDFSWKVTLYYLLVTTGKLIDSGNINNLLGGKCVKCFLGQYYKYIYGLVNTCSIVGLGPK